MSKVNKSGKELTDLVRAGEAFEYVPPGPRAQGVVFFARKGFTWKQKERNTCLETIFKSAQETVEASRELNQRLVVEITAFERNQVSYRYYDLKSHEPVTKEHVPLPAESVVSTAAKIHDLTLRHFAEKSTRGSVMSALYSLGSWLKKPFSSLYRLIAKKGDEASKFASLMAPLQPGCVGEFNHQMVLDHIDFMAKYFQELTPNDSSFLGYTKSAELIKNGPPGDKKSQQVSSQPCKVSGNEIHILIQEEIELHLDVNDPSLASFARRISKDGKHHIYRLVYGDKMILPRNHPLVKGVSSKDIRSDKQQYDSSNSAQRLSHILSEGTHLARVTRQALESGDLKKIKSAVSKLKEAVEGEAPVLLPFAIGEGREYLPHFLVIKKTDENTFEITDVCFSTKEKESGLIDTCSTFRLDPIADENRDPDPFGAERIRELLAIQSFSRPMDKKETAVRPQRQKDQSLEALFQSWKATRVGNPIVKREPTRDPVTALYDVIEQLGIKNGSLAISEDRVEDRTYARYRYYQVYFNHLVETYDRYESQLSNTEQIRVLEQIQDRAQGLHQELKDELGIDAAKVILDSFSAGLRQKFDAHKLREKKEAADLARLSSSAKRFKAELTTSIEKSALASQLTLKDALMSRILPQHQEKIDALGSGFRPETLSELLEIAEKYLMEQKDPLAAKMFLASILKAVPPPTDNFWESVVDVEAIEKWGSALGELGERFFEAAMLSGSFPLPPHEILEFHSILPFIQLRLFQQKVPVMQRRFNERLEANLNNTEIVQKLRTKREAFIELRKDEVAAQTTRRLKGEWARQDSRHSEAKRALMAWNLLPKRAQGPRPEIPEASPNPKDKQRVLEEEIRRSQQQDQLLQQIRAVNFNPDNFLGTINYQSGLGDINNSRFIAMVGRFFALLEIPKSEISYIDPDIFNAFTKTHTWKQSHWLLSGDRSALFGNDFQSQARYQSCIDAFNEFKQHLTGGEEFPHFISGRKDSFLIGYDKLGDETRFPEPTLGKYIKLGVLNEATDEDRLENNVRFHERGVFDLECAYDFLGPKEIGLLSRQLAMRDALEDPSGMIRRFSGWDRKGKMAQLVLVNNDPPKLKELQKRFGEFDRLYLTPWCADNRESHCCYTLTDKKNELGPFRINTQKIGAPPTIYHRPYDNGNMPLVIAQDALQNDQERELAQRVEKNPQFPALSPAEEYCLRTTSVANREKGNEIVEFVPELDVTSISNLWEYLYQNRSALKIEHVRDTFYQRFFSPGLLREQLLTHPHLFIDNKDALDAIIDRLKKHQERATLLFLMDVSERIRSMANQLRSTIIGEVTTSILKICPASRDVIEEWIREKLEGDSPLTREMKSGQTATLYGEFAYELAQKISDEDDVAVLTLRLTTSGGLSRLLIYVCAPKISDSLYEYNARDFLSDFRENEEKRDQKIFATHLLSHFNRYPPKDGASLAEWRAIISALYILQKSPFPVGHSGLQEENIALTKRDLLPRLRNELQNNQAFRNELLNRLSGHKEEWEEQPHNPYCYTPSGQDEIVLDLVSGMGCATQIETGGLKQFPERFKSDPNFTFLFGKPAKMWVKEQACDNQVIEYLWTDPSGVPITLRTSGNKLDIIQKRRNIEYRFQEIELKSRKRDVVLGPLFSTHKNTFVQEQIAEKGMWVPIDSKGKLDSRRALVARQGQDLEKDPIELHLASSVIRKATLGEGSEKKVICAQMKKKGVHLFKCCSNRELLMLSSDGTHIDEVRFPEDPSSKKRLILKRTREEGWHVAGNANWKLALSNTKQIEAQFGANWRENVLALRNSETGALRLWVFPYFATNVAQKGKPLHYIKTIRDLLELGTDALHDFSSILPLMGLAGDNTPAQLQTALDFVKQVAAISGTFVEAETLATQLMQGSDETAQFLGTLIDRTAKPTPTLVDIDASGVQSTHRGFLYLSYLAATRQEWGRANRYLTQFVEKGHSDAADFKQLKEMIQGIGIQQFVTKALNFISDPTSLTPLETAYWTKFLVSIFSLEHHFEGQHGQLPYSEDKKLLLLLLFLTLFSQHRKQRGHFRNQLHEHGLILTDEEMARITIRIPKRSRIGSLRALIEMYDRGNGQRVISTLREKLQQLKSPLKPFELQSKFSKDQLHELLLAIPQHYCPDPVEKQHKRFGHYPKIETVVGNFWSYWEWVIEEDLTDADLAFLRRPLPEGVDSVVDTARHLLLLIHQFKMEQDEKWKARLETISTGVKNIKIAAGKLPPFGELYTKQSKLWDKQLLDPTLGKLCKLGFYKFYAAYKLYISYYTSYKEVGGKQVPQGPMTDFLTLGESLLIPHFQDFLEGILPERLEATTEETNPAVEELQDLLKDLVGQFMPMLATVQEADDRGGSLPSGIPLQRKKGDYPQIRLEKREALAIKEYFIDQKAETKWAEREERAKKYFAAHSDNPRQQARFKEICDGIELAKDKLVKKTKSTLAPSKLRPLYQNLKMRIEALRKEQHDMKVKLLEATQYHAKELGLLHLFADGKRVSEDQILNAVFDLYQDWSTLGLEDGKSEQLYATLITNFILCTTQLQQYEKSKAQCWKLQRIMREVHKETKGSGKAKIDRVKEFLKSGKSRDWDLASFELERYLSEGGNWKRYADETNLCLKNQLFTRRYLVTEVRRGWISRDFANDALERMLADLKDKNKKPDRFVRLIMGAGKSDFIFPKAVELLLQRGKQPVMVTNEELVMQLHESLGQRSYLFEFDINFGLKNEDPTNKEIEEHLERILRTLKELKSEKRAVLTAPKDLAGLRNKRIELQDILRSELEGRLFEDLDDPAKGRLKAYYVQLRKLCMIESFFKAKKVCYLIDEDTNFDINFEYNFATGEHRTVDSTRFTMAEKMVRHIYERHTALYKKMVGNDLRSVENLDEELKKVAETLVEDDFWWTVAGWEESQWKEIDKKELVTYLIGERESLPTGLPRYPSQAAEAELQKFHYLIALRVSLTLALPSVAGINPKLDRGICRRDGVTVVPYMDGTEKNNVLYGNEPENIFHHILHYLGASNTLNEELFVKNYDDFPNDEHCSPELSEMTWREWKDEIMECFKRNRRFVQNPTSGKYETLYEAFIGDESLGLHRLVYLRHLMLYTNYIKVYAEQIVFNTQDCVIGPRFEEGGDARIASGTGDLFSLNLARPGEVRPDDVLGELLLLMDVEDKCEKSFIDPLAFMLEKAKGGTQALMNYDYEVLGNDCERLAAYLQANGVKRQIIYRTRRHEKKMMDRGGEVMDYEASAIEKGALFLYGPSDTRGVHFHVPVGEEIEGCALFGVGNKIDDVAQMLGRMRQLGLGQKVKIAFDKKTEKQIRRSLGLGTEDHLLVVHALKYCVINTLNAEQLYHTKAMLKQIRTPLDLELDASARAPVPEGENIAPYVEFEGKVLFPAIRDLHIISNEIQWLQDYAPPKYVNTLTFLNAQYDKQLEMIKKLSSRLQESMAEFNSRYNPPQDANRGSGLWGWIKNLAQQAVGNYPLIQAKYVGLQRALAKAKIVIKEEKAKLEVEAHQKFFKNHLAERIPLHQNEGAHSEQQVQLQQEQQQEEEQEQQVESSIQPTSYLRATGLVDYREFIAQDVTRGRFDRYQYRSMYSDHYARVSDTISDSASGRVLENLYISERAHELRRIVTGVPAFRILVAKSAGNSMVTLIVTADEYAERLRLFLETERVKNDLTTNYQLGLYALTNGHEILCVDRGNDTPDFTSEEFIEKSILVKLVVDMPRFSTVEEDYLWNTLVPKWKREGIYEGFYRDLDTEFKTKQSAALLRRIEDGDPKLLLKLARKKLELLYKKCERKPLEFSAAEEKQLARWLGGLGPAQYKKLLEGVRPEFHEFINDLRGSAKENQGEARRDKGKRPMLEEGYTPPPGAGVGLPTAETIGHSS